MTATTGAFIIGTVAALIGYHWVTADVRRKADERDHYARLYKEAVEREVEHLRRLPSYDAIAADEARRADWTELERWT